MRRAQPEIITGVSFNAAADTFSVEYRTDGTRRGRLTFANRVGRSRSGIPEVTCEASARRAAEWVLAQRIPLTTRVYRGSAGQRPFLSRRRAAA